MVSEDGPATLNILDPAFRVHSAQTAEAARRHWCAHTPLGLAVLRYEDCQAMLRDRRLRQVGTDHLIAQGITAGPLFEMWGRFVLNVEGDDHARLRRLFGSAFSSAAIDRLRPRMRQIVHALVDTFARDGACEFMSAFADHYPPLVMAELLGLPEAEHAEFVAWGKAIAHVLGYEAPQRLVEIEAALAALYGAVDRIAMARRRQPAADLISVLVRAADDGTLDADELRANIAGLVLAGQDSTRGQLGLALEIFARHPAQWASLAAEPGLVERATEEVLRAQGVDPIVWRVATEDLTYRDTPITAGTRLWLMVAAAHHDPAVFPSPGFDIRADRPAQLSFGLGPHFCLGAQLSRVEMHEAFPILARRLPNLSLTAAPTHRPQLAGFIGPEHLLIRFTPQ